MGVYEGDEEKFVARSAAFVQGRATQLAGMVAGMLKARGGAYDRV